MGEVWGMSYGWDEGGMEACGNLNSSARCLSFIFRATGAFQSFQIEQCHIRFTFSGDVFSFVKKRQRLSLRRV